MRISDNTIYRKYMNTLGKSAAMLGNLNLKASSGRGFLTGSEDPIKALKAMKVRRSLAKMENYQSNISEVSSIMTERESAISQISDVLSEAGAKLLQGENGTYNENDRKSIAEQMRSYQSTVFEMSNSSFGDKYVFSGWDQYTEPFTVDLSTGALLYHGQDVNVNGVFDTAAFKASEELEVNIGTEASMNAAYSGVELLGYGTTSVTVASGTIDIPNNIYNLLGEIADMFENNDLANIDAYADKLQQAYDDVNVKYGEIGAQSSFVSFISDRLTNSETNALERQKDLEGIDTAQAIMDYNQQQTAYNASLAMGSKLIQKSLFDYLQ